MQASLHWSREANTLRLEGELDRDTLLSLWEQREALVNAVELIDVSALQRVDSSGLALLVHLREITSQQGGSLRFGGNRRQIAVVDHPLQPATNYCFCGLKRLNWPFSSKPRSRTGTFAYLRIRHFPLLCQPYYY